MRRHMAGYNRSHENAELLCQRDPTLSAQHRSCMTPSVLLRSAGPLVHGLLAMGRRLCWTVEYGVGRHAAVWLTAAGELCMHAV